HDHMLAVGGPAPQGSYNLEAVITHEVGHFLGLAHSADMNSIMFAHYHANATELTPDDIQGICAIYPPDHTRITSAGVVPEDPCSVTPRHGFSTECASDAGAAGGGGGDQLMTDDGGSKGCTISHCGVSRAPSAASGSAAGLALAWMIGLSARRSRRLRSPRVRH